MDILNTYFENYNKNILSSNDNTVNFDVLLENKEIKKRLNNNRNIDDNNNISIFGFKYKPLYRRFKEYLDNKYENIGYIKKKNVLHLCTFKTPIF